MKNKTGIYFKYAIGEIVLVVIGILIALQINNWNTQKKQTSTELEILENILENLNSDVQDMELNTGIYKTAQKSTIEVFKSLNNPSYNQDSLNFYFGSLKNGAFFIETTSAFENLKTIGFEIVKNDSLKKSIMRIYGKQYQYIENLENGHMDFLQTKLHPLILDNLITITITNAKPVNIAELKKNHRFIETLKYNNGWLSLLIEAYSSTIVEVEFLMEQIEFELEQRK